MPRKRERLYVAERYDRWANGYSGGWSPLLTIRHSVKPEPVERALKAYAEKHRSPDGYRVAQYVRTIPRE